MWRSGRPLCRLPKGAQGRGERKLAVRHGEGLGPFTSRTYFE